MPRLVAAWYAVPDVVDEALALDEASLVAGRGTLHAMRRENGTGTTLMRIAFGLVRPDAGDLRAARLTLADGILVVYNGTVRRTPVDRRVVGRLMLGADS